MSAPVVVLVSAAGAAWESTALAAMSARRDVAVLKRCVDVEDLLASAATGQAQVAVVGLDAVGLDASALERLRLHQVAPVVVAGHGVDERARAHADRIGARRLVADDDPAALVAAVLEAGLSEPAGSADSGGAAEPDAPDVPESADAADVPSPAEPGRVVVVWGPAGAPGRSTVAVGLAAALADLGRPAVLVDADPQGGALAHQLGVIEEVSGLLAAARLDVTGALERDASTVVRTLAPRCGLVTGLPRADRWSEVRAGVLERLLAALAREGDVVVDVGASLEDDPAAELAGRPPRQQLTLEALACADTIVAVGAPDPVGLARIARGLAELREVGVVADVVVLNRMRTTLGWSEREIVAMLREVCRAEEVVVVPDDPSAVDRAQAGGHPVTDADGPAARALRVLAASVAGVAPPAPAGGVRRRRAGRARRR